MSKRSPSPEKQTLRQRLEHEAADSRPEFSESLHQRIIAAVGQHHATVAARHRAVMKNSWVRGFAALAVTAALLVAAAIGWRLVRPLTSPNDTVEVVKDTRTWIEGRQAIDQWANQTTTGLDGLISFTSAQPRESVLKHDARLVASTLLQPLPVEVPLNGQQ